MLLLLASLLKQLQLWCWWWWWWWCSWGPPGRPSLYNRLFSKSPNNRVVFVCNGIRYYTCCMTMMSVARQRRWNVGVSSVAAPAEKRIFIQAWRPRCVYVRTVTVSVSVSVTHQLTVSSCINYYPSRTCCDVTAGCIPELRTIKARDGQWSALPVDEFCY